jgi:multidrug efflux pump
MNFTDLFIRRPVLAAVVSLMILALGIRAVYSLQTLQFPRTENAVVTITTTYYGADPALVAGFITTPLENAIAQANGIDYLTSTSQSSTSTITANLRLNYNADKALTEINTKVNSVLNQLPTGTQQPVLTVSIGQTIDSMYIVFSSDVLPVNKITDYLVRVIQPKLQTVAGVQTAEILGGENYAMRAWLDPKKLAAYGLTATDVSQALANNDYIAGLGNTKGQMVQVNLTASTNLHSVEEFKNLVIKQSGSTLIRLQDVAEVTLGGDTYDVAVSADARPSVFLGIKVAPDANLLNVAATIRTIFPELQAQLPDGLNGQILYDATAFVNSAIHEVEFTLLSALGIVTLVIFAFLGSFRAVLIAVVAIPLSLVGTFAMMLLFGFSINLLTLLSLVLAIGLVVDDAIIVVENVNRHLEDGMSPIAASIMAGRELGGPIIAMTLVLAAVYVPIGFQGGLTGALFVEFAFTLVGAVTISAIVALTLSPMMCSRLLTARDPQDRSFQSRLIDFIDRRFEGVVRVYSRWLHGSLNYLSVTATFAVIILGSTYFLFTGASTELAPEEDQGVLLLIGTPAPNATLQQKVLYSNQINQIVRGFPEINLMAKIDAPGNTIGFSIFKPWDQRKRTAIELKPIMQKAIGTVAGEQIAIVSQPALPGSSGLPVQFEITTTEPFDRLNKVAQEFLQRVQDSGVMIFVNTDLRIDQPQSTLELDRDKTASLGINLSDVGSALGSALGGGYVNYFSLDGRSYKVIPQVLQPNRLNADQLLDYYIRTPAGDEIPLSTIAHIKTETVPESLNRFQQLNSAVIQGVPFPGVSLGDVLASLKKLAADTLPPGYSIDYGGESRQYIQESSGFVTTIFFAAIIVFLALAALFESFRDPIIILVSVPMSIAGALIFISLGFWGMALNIYTEVGLVTLMGLISKHGILIVEFANEAQIHGKSKRAAIEEAAAIRLRPILMTTAAMVLGVLPLLMAVGAGAVSRFEMGLVIASGLTIGTLFTLFVVPGIYMLLAADHSKRTAAQTEALIGNTPEPGAA